jgi:hypothetical protein
VKQFLQVQTERLRNLARRKFAVRINNKSSKGVENFRNNFSTKQIASFCFCQNLSPTQNGTTTTENICLFITGRKRTSTQKQGIRL